MMFRNAMLIGGVAVVALAVPAIAHMTKSDRPAQTRAGVEAKVRTHFAKLDVNKDGFITAIEVDAMRGMAKSARFEMMDGDKDGSISRAEFDAAHADGRQRRGGHGMRMGFGGGRLIMMADADRDGRVSQAEAVAGALALFDRADSNKDGTLSADERRGARAAMRDAWRAKAAGG